MSEYISGFYISDALGSTVINGIKPLNAWPVCVVDGQQVVHVIWKRGEWPAPGDGEVTEAIESLPAETVSALIARGLGSSKEGVANTPQLYETWQPGVEYKLGQTLIHSWIEGEGEAAIQHTALYQINQDHTSQAHYPPHGPGLTALYDVAVNRDEEIEWFEPTSTRYFKLGDKMRYTDGLLYESLLAVNVYSPVAYPAGWRLIEESVDPDPESEILPWEQRFENYYQLGDKVTHGGFTWECTGVDGGGNNVWQPGVYGWTKI